MSLNDVTPLPLRGNKIGHDPNNPVWYAIPLHHKKRSHFPLKVMARLKDAYFYPKAVLCDLQNHSPTRQRRSERRNILLDILEVMVYHMDDMSFRVGRPLGNTFHYLSLQQIADKLDAPLNRIKRAFKILVRLGYVVTEPSRFQFREGHYKAISAVKKLTPKLFKALGFAWSSIELLRSYYNKKTKPRLSTISYAKPTLSRRPFVPFAVRTFLKKANGLLRPPV